MRYCKRCVLPDTKPGVVFDAEGICSACRSVERKHEIDWEARGAQLQQICDEATGTIVLFLLVEAKIVLLKLIQ